MKTSFACPWRAALGLALAAGCALSDAPDLGGRSPGASSAVDAAELEVGYLRVLRNDRGTARYEACAATLISPAALLTAAHCLPRPGTTDTFDGFYTGSGALPSPNAPPQNLTWHGVTEFAICRADLAVVRLAQPVQGAMFAGQQLCPRERRAGELTPGSEATRG